MSFDVFFSLYLSHGFQVRRSRSLPLGRRIDMLQTNDPALFISVTSSAAPSTGSGIRQSPAAPTAAPASRNPAPTPVLAPTSVCEDHESESHDSHDNADCDEST